MIDKSENKILKALAEQETERRHAQDIDIDIELSQANEIAAWLRSLAPLTDEQIYNSLWVD